MKKYLLLITTDKPFTHKTHPNLFEFLAAKSRSIRISDDAFCFEQEEGITETYAQLEQHLKKNDELALFEIAGVRWGTGRPDFDTRMRELFS